VYNLTYPSNSTVILKLTFQHHYSLELKDVPYMLTIIHLVALGGLVVSVLATGPKVRGFKPGRGRWILRVIKSVARLPSEGK
jgi:hypothetical protein